MQNCIRTFGRCRILHDLMRNWADVFDRNFTRSRCQAEQQRSHAGQVAMQCELIGQIPNDDATIIGARCKHRRINIDGQIVHVTRVLGQCFQAVALQVPQLNGFVQAAGH